MLQAQHALSPWFSTRARRLCTAPWSARLRRLHAIAVVALTLFTVVGARAEQSAPPGYDLVAVSPLGRSFSTRKPGVKTLSQLLQTALTDLTGYFGARPRVLQAYENQQQPGSGVATFTVRYGNVPVKGVMFGKLVKGGAALAVIAARADAPPEEWRRLFAGGSQRSAAPSAETASAAPGKPGKQTPTGPLKTYNFADGTGSISLAPGWQTNLSSCKAGVFVFGPAGQRIALGVPVTVNLPNSQGAQLSRQLGTPVALAPFVAPHELLQVLGPHLSRMGVSQRMPAFSYDHMTLVQNIARPGAPKGTLAAQVRYGVSEGGRHHLAEAQVEQTPPGGYGFFMFYFDAELRAPDESYERDLPLMRKIAASFRVNGDVAAQAIQADTAQRTQHFDAVRRQQQANSDAFFSNLHAQQQASSAQFEAQRSAEAASDASLRSADAFDEVIRGVRTVEDTRTGERHSVDLGYVDNIVDNLNYGDPDRYRQIPLADEVRGE